jgi:anti-sigma B factor antagonist
MYQLTLERFDHLLITHFVGDLTLPEAVDLRRELEKIVMREKVKDIILNLALVENVDNSGLGVLVAVSCVARSCGKRLILCQSAEKVTAALKQAALDGFFPLLEDDEDLLAVMPD